MSTPTATEVFAEHGLKWNQGDEGRCLCGYWLDASDDPGQERIRRMHASHQLSKLLEHGYSIVARSEIREMIGPSREVDNCPKCGETAEWEKNAYDLRDNDDERYSWRAYCEACNLDLELMPWPNPPVAAAAAAEEDQ